MSLESALGDKNYGIRLTADGEGIVGAMDDTTKAAERTEKQLEDTGKATRTSAQQSKTFADALKQQTGALADTSSALDKFEDLTGRRVPSAMRNLVVAGGPAAIAIAAVGYAVYASIANHIAFERQVTRTEVAILAQARGADITRESISGLTSEVARLPGVSWEMAGQVVNAIARVRSIGGPQMAELALLTNNYAAAIGEDAPAAAKKLAASLADPAKGAKELEREFGLLSVTQLTAIDRMNAYGQTSEAQGVLIDALRTRLEGLADKGLSPVALLWERIKAAAAPAVAAIGDIPELAYYQPPAPRAFAADARAADNAANDALAKNAYALSQQYAPEVAQRQRLEGARSQLQDAVQFGAVRPENLQAVQAALANIDEELNKSTDGLQRYLNASLKMNEAARESVYGTRSRTQAQVALAQVEELYATGQVKGTAATMERIRATLGAASASEQLAMDRQREMQLDQQYLAARQAIQDQQDEAMRRFMTAGRTRVQELELETDLITKQAARERDAAQVTNNRYQQITIQTQLQVENNAAREKAIEFRKLELDFQAASIGRTEEEIAAMTRALDARKQMLGEAIDARFAAQGARDSAQAVRQEWESQQRALAANVQGTLTHALVTAFLDGGRSGGEALKAALKTTMATLVLEPLIRPIMMPIANIASQISMSLFGSMGSAAAAGGVGSGFSSLGFAGMGAWLGKLGGGGSALQLGGPGAGAVTYTNAGGATAASSGALATTGFGALAFGDIMSAQNGRDWTRTLYGGAPPMAGRINDKLGIPEFFTDPLGSVFGHGGDTRKQYTLFVTRAADGSYQLEQGGNPFAGVPSDGVVQNLGRNVDVNMLNSMQLWEQGGHGEAIEAVIQRIMARISPAMLPDMATLVSSRGSLRSQLRDTLGVDSLQSFRDSLNVSDLGGKGPTDQLEAARQIYERERDSVEGGDYSRVGAFESAAQQYLNLGRGVYASGQGYQDILGSVNAALDEIGAKQKDALGDLATQVIQSGKDTVDAINNQTKQLVDALKQVNDQIRRSSSAS